MQELFFDLLVLARFDEVFILQIHTQSSRSRHCENNPDQNEPFFPLLSAKSFRLLCSNFR